MYVLKQNIVICNKFIQIFGSWKENEGLEVPKAKNRIKATVKILRNPLLRFLYMSHMFYSFNLSLSFETLQLFMFVCSTVRFHSFAFMDVVILVTINFLENFSFLQNPTTKLEKLYFFPNTYPYLSIYITL